MRTCRILFARSAGLMVLCILLLFGAVRVPDSASSSSGPACPSVQPMEIAPTGIEEPDATEGFGATTVPTAIPTRMIQATSIPFLGIQNALTARWTYPLPVEADTPEIGRFGAKRKGSRLHAGIDLYAPAGTEVLAMTDGLVREILCFYENLLDIEVENADGTMIRYCELTPLVGIGDEVRQGQVIARLKPNSSGTCMLHLEIYATDVPDALTQTGNRSVYPHVGPIEGTFMRRQDLVDPTPVQLLPRWIAYPDAPGIRMEES